MLRRKGKIGTRRKAVGRNALKATPLGKSIPPKVHEELTLLRQSSGNWANRASVTADAIIKIAAKHGVPVETILEMYTRRVSDASVVNAVNKRMAGLARGLERQKGPERKH